MRDRHAADLALAGAVRERRIRRLDAQVATSLADEFQACIAKQRAGQQPASTRTWNPLQMPSTRPPSAANFFTAFITGEKLCDGAAAQIVAIGKSARQDHGIHVAEGRESCQMNSACWPRFCDTAYHAS